MKTKTFFLVCLFLGVGITTLSAQNGKNGSGNLKYELTLDNWAGPVFCDGVLFDFVACQSLMVEVTVHYINGEEIRGINKPTNCMVTSVNSCEVFKAVAGFDHWSDKKGYDNFHLNLIGSKGNNISMHLVYDLSTYEIVEIQANCH
jgi:hypothetical protein